MPISAGTAVDGILDSAVVGQATLLSSMNLNWGKSRDTSKIVYEIFVPQLGILFIV